MTSAQIINCIACKEPVRPRQQGLQCPSLPKPENMARAANRLRQQLRPEDPTDLAFEISEENIPADFLKADVCIRSKRHLVFATSQQLQQLVKAKNWYVDGTFKLCRQPFSQLFTINAFVKSGEQAKQVPLLFVVMSGRKKRDYRAVLQEVLSILPSPPAVRRITLDFERALWTVFRQLLPDVSLQGCLFHWTQALWRKVSIDNLNKDINPHAHTKKKHTHTHTKKKKQENKTKLNLGLTKFFFN